MLDEMKEVTPIPPVSLAWPEGCPALSDKKARKIINFAVAAPKL